MKDKLKELKFQKFKKIIKNYIKESGYNQKGLADELTVSESSLSKYLTGTNRISIEILDKLCRVLRMTPEDKDELFILAGYLPPGSYTHEPTPPHKPPPLTNLPGLTPHFVDREQEVKDLLGYLYPKNTVVISGIGGLGKTELAIKTILELGKELDERFPDGFIYHNYKLKPSTGQIIDTITYHFNAVPSPYNLTVILAGKKALLLLDGAEIPRNS
jgi:transcriptional regulator with XRE-family HTH domain